MNKRKTTFKGNRASKHHHKLVLPWGFPFFDAFLIIAAILIPSSVEKRAKLQDTLPSDTDMGPNP